MNKTYTYQQRMESLLKTKLEHVRLKQDVDKIRPGVITASTPKKRLDADDHSDMVPPDGFSFIPESNHPSGGVFGAKAVGENFRRLLETHPVWVDPMSSLAGAWMVWFHEDYLSSPFWNPDFDYSHLKARQELYGIVDGIGADNHFLPDMRIGLKLGWGGLLDKIRYYKKLNSGGDIDFYEALEGVVMGTQKWIKKHVTQAKKMVQEETNPQLKENLLKIAEINNKLISAPPDTFYEACQWVTWYVMIMIMYNCNGAIGAMDDFLFPFFDRDIKAGVLDEEEAIFHIACMLVKESKYIQLGGTNPDGTDRTNRLSYVILEAVHRLKAPSEICVRVHDDMDPEFLKLAVTYLFRDGTGSPNFIGHKGITEGFMKNGYPAEIARMREKCGCSWCSIPGREYTKNDTIKINFVKIFDVALRDMMSEGAAEKSGEALWQYFVKHLKICIHTTAEGMDFHMRHMHEVFPELVIDLLCCGPIEKGLDAPNGALEYYNMCIDGAGIATAADSFAAVIGHVGAGKNISWERLMECMDDDFAGCEDIRVQLKNTPHYGAGGTEADSYAARISKTFTELVKEKGTPDGHNMIPGLFSWVNTINMGKIVGATPNGRHAGEPISFGANPDPGFADSGALTAMANAVASVQCGYGNPAPLHLDVDPVLGSDEEAVEKFIAFMKCYFDMGGTLLNVNILNEQQVIEAHKNPELYPNLIVRVTGFSAYFSSLSEEYRQLTVDRIIRGL